MPPVLVVVLRPWAFALAAALLLAACATDPAPRSVATTAAAPRALAVDGGRNVRELPVYPTTSQEIDTLCQYKVAEAQPGDVRQRSNLMSGCRQAYNSDLSARRRACGANPQCLRQNTSFAGRFETLKQFNDFQRLATFGDLTAFARRLAAADELGLLPAVRARLHARCAASSLTATSIDGWQRLASDYSLAGDGGACSGKAVLAKARADELERLERQAARDRAIAQAQDDLVQARTWKQLAAFIDRYQANDVAQLLPAAQARLDQARKTELAQVQSLPLVELETFWRQSAGEPDELRELAKTRLVQESLKQGSFAGAARAYRVSGDLDHIARRQHLARSPPERLELETLAVQATVRPATLVALSFDGRVGAGRETEEAHAGLFALYSKYGHVPVAGTLTVQRAKDSPVAMRLGRYRVNVALEMTYTRKFERKSRMLGNADRSTQERVLRRASVVIEPGAFVGKADVSFGNLVAARLQRGSQGGVEQEWIDGDPMVLMTVESIEPLNN